MSNIKFNTISSENSKLILRTEESKINPFESNKNIEIDNNFLKTLNDLNEENIIKLETVDLINSTFSKINNFLNDIDKKIFNILEHQENDFLYQYKNQMVVVQKEIIRIRKKIDKNRLKEKKEKKLKLLFDERNFFRAQSLRLFEENKEIKQKFHDLNILFINLKEDKLYLESYLLNLKKENEELKHTNKQQYDNYLNKISEHKNLAQKSEKKIQNIIIDEKKEDNQLLNKKIRKLYNINENLKKQIENYKIKNNNEFVNNNNLKQFIYDAFNEIKKDKNCLKELDKNEKITCLKLFLENELLIEKFCNFLNINQNNKNSNFKIKTQNINRIESAKTQTTVLKNKIFFKLK